jgi:hypothetical protein
MCGLKILILAGSMERWLRSMAKRLRYRQPMGKR